MSRETNEGVMMYFKKITMNLLTIVHLLVEPITPLEKQRLLWRQLFPLPLLSLLYLPPFLASSFSAIF